MSDFRVAYSKLIRDIWDNPNLESEIASNPSKLTAYGFTAVPNSVRFENSKGTSSVAGYEQQQEDAKSGNVTFYIPPKPALGVGHGAALAGDICCCCCPCCTCT